MTLTLVPHVRHRWTVVLTGAGTLRLLCAKCGRSAALDRLGHRSEKMVAHPEPDVCDEPDAIQVDHPLT
jgi:hypothetical protein